MEVSMIGLGKMGMGIAENLLRQNYTVKAYDILDDNVDKFKSLGGIFFNDIQNLLKHNNEKKIVWLMLPAGETTNKMIEQVVEYLREDDILIDAGNSHYNDSLKNSDLCRSYGINFVDVGTSGGVSGAREGACMMIGSSREIYDQLASLFSNLCVENGNIYAGPAGSGHYLKMVHNGIEYGMMQSIAEGFNLLTHSPYEYELAEVAKVFNNGSVIRSWLMELTENIYRQEIDFKQIAGIIPSSGEGKWTIEEALRLNINLPVITQSLMTRYSSEDLDKTGEKIVALLRNQFGGHAFIEGE